MENKIPVKEHLKKFDDKTDSNIEYISLTNRDQTRTVFIQTFITNIASATRKYEYFVSDGYNKKEYKGIKTARKAFHQAVGDFICAGYLPCDHIPDLVKDLYW